VELQGKKPYSQATKPFTKGMAMSERRRFFYNPPEHPVEFRITRSWEDTLSLTLEPTSDWDDAMRPGQMGFGLRVHAGENDASVFLRSNGQVLAMNGTPAVALMPLIFPDEGLADGEQWESLLQITPDEPPLGIQFTYQGLLGSLHRFDAHATTKSGEEITGTIVFDREEGQIVLSRFSWHAGDRARSETWMRTDLPEDKIPSLDD
jgi:hypothetical protein